MPARIPEEIIKEIRDLRRAEHSFTDISHKLGVSWRSVRRHTEDIILKQKPKTCSQCNKTDKETTFYKKGLVCKQCASINRRKHYVDNKEYYIDKSRRHQNRIKKYIRSLKEDTPCADCKKIFPYFVMDFDHLQDKEYLISHAYHKKTALSSIQEEIAKCDIVCSNCHRFRTHKRRKKGA